MPQPFTLTPSPQQNMEAFNVPTSLITTPPPIQPSAPAVVTSKIANDQLGAFNKTMLQANQAMASKQQQNTVQQQAQNQLDAQTRAMVPTEDSNRKALEGMTQGLKEVKSALDPQTQQQQQAQVKTPAAETLSPTDRAIQENNKLQEEAFNTYNEQMRQFQSGTFPYTPAQQAEIDSLKSSYRQAIEAQRQYNQNYEQGITKLGLVTGISRYSPAQNMGQIQRAVSDGISRVRKIEDGMASAIAQMENGFQQNNFKLVDAAYQKYSDFLQERSATLEKTKAQAQAASDAIIKKQQELKDAVFDLSQPIGQAGKSVQDYVSKQLQQYPSLISVFTQAGGTMDDFQNLNAGQVAQLIQATPEYALQKQKEQSAAFGSGEIGEYQRALSLGIIPAGTSFAAFKNIGKKESSDGGAGFLPGSSGFGEQVDAYARQYASTGVPPTIPESERKAGVTLSAIQNAARALPKPQGMVYDANTGIRSSQVSQALQDGVVALSRAIQQIGSLGSIFENIKTGANIREITEYDSVRAQFLSDLLLAKSGAAVSEQEFKRLSDLLPSSTTLMKTKGKQKLDVLARESKKTLDAKLNANNLKISGYNDVDLSKFDE